MNLREVKVRLVFFFFVYRVAEIFAMKGPRGRVCLANVAMATGPAEGRRAPLSHLARPTHPLFFYK